MVNGHHAPRSFTLTRLWSVLLLQGGAQTGLIHFSRWHPILKFSRLSEVIFRPVNGWAAELITWPPTTMMVMWTMSWRNLRSCTIGGAKLRKLDKGKRQKQNFLNGQIGSTLCGCEIFVEAHFTESNYNR